MKIRSLRDLARHLDASSTDKDAIARRIYKVTSCGAGFSITEPTCRTQARRYRATLRQESLEASVAKIELVVDAKTSRAARPPYPQAVIDMLAIEAKDGRVSLPALVSPSAPVSLEHVRSEVSSMDEIDIEQDRGHEIVIAFSVSVALSIPASKRRATGISVCGYCEGTDAELPSYHLAFPFTSEELEAALQSCDDDADELWNQTHGCEHCGDEDDSGYRAVKPDCRACNGNGIVI